MKYIYCILISLLIANNSFSIDPYCSNVNINRPNMVHTLPIDSASRFKQRMELLRQDRLRQAIILQGQAIILQERRLRNVENYIISTQVGPHFPFVPVR